MVHAMMEDYPVTMCAPILLIRGTSLAPVILDSNSTPTGKLAVVRILLCQLLFFFKFQSNYNNINDK